MARGPLEIIIGAKTSAAQAAIKALAADIEKMEEAGGKAGAGAGEGVEQKLDSVSAKAKQAGDDISEGLAGGFGVAGIAAGAVVTAILAQLSQTQAALDETRAAAGDLAKELYASGGEIPLQAKVDKLFDTLSKEVRPNGPLAQLIDQYVDFGTVVDRLGDVAKSVGRPLDSLKDALTGDDIAGAKDILKDVNEQLDVMKQSKNGITFFWDRQPLEDYKTSLEGVIDQYEIADKLNTPEIMRAGEIDKLAAAWKNAADRVSDYLEPDQAGFEAFNVTRWLADVEDQMLRADEIKAELVGLPPEIANAAQQIWAEQGVLVADKFIDGYQNATPDIQARMVAGTSAMATAAGEAGGTAVVDAMTGKLVAYTPPPVKVQMIPDDSQLRAWSPPMKVGYVSYVANNPFQAALDAKYGPNG